MRNQVDTSVGKKVFIYLEGKKLECIKKKARPKTAIIVPAIIVDNSGKKVPKITAVCTKKIFYSKAPYGGHGIKLNAADPAILTNDDIEFLLGEASSNEFVKFCKENGFNQKKFRAAFNKYSQIAFGKSFKKICLDPKKPKNK